MNLSTQRASRSGREGRASSRKHGQSSSRSSPVVIEEIEPQYIVSEAHPESHAVLASGSVSTEDEVQFVEESPAPVESSATGDLSTKKSLFM